MPFPTAARRQGRDRRHARRRPRLPRHQDGAAGGRGFPQILQPEEIRGGSGGGRRLHSRRQRRPRPSIKDPLVKEIAEILAKTKYHQNFFDQDLGPSVGRVINDVSVDVAASKMTPEAAAARDPGGRGAAIAVSAATETVGRFGDGARIEERIRPRAGAARLRDARSSSCRRRCCCSRCSCSCRWRRRAATVSSTGTASARSRALHRAGRTIYWVLDNPIFLRALFNNRAGHRGFAWPAAAAGARRRAAGSAAAPGARWRSG